MIPETFQSLSLHVNRYERLEAMFRTWHQLIKDLPTFGSSPFGGSLKIGDIGAGGLEANTFTVTLAGTTMFVRFDYRPGGEHGTDGILQSYVLEPVTKEPLFLQSVPFKGTGETKYMKQFGDPAYLEERQGAFLVIGLLLKDAIERK